MHRNDFGDGIGIEVLRFSSQADENHRFTSFDYCYNYFITTPDLLRDMEKSCLTLGFYLASWGMFRGSSFLLQKSAKYFEPTIDYIASLDRSVWEIDVDSYTEANIDKILKIYGEIKGRLILNRNAELTLVTKVLLGIFGFVPAFDNYFSTTFRRIFNGECGFRRMNKESLKLIGEFYVANREAIDDLSSKMCTTDFRTGQKSAINYPKAKIIDMYGFMASQPAKNSTKESMSSLSSIYLS